MSPAVSSPRGSPGRTTSAWIRLFSGNGGRCLAKNRSGKIINIASIAGKGFRGTSNVAYAGSKGAVIAMTRIAASRLARFDINVNAICPGVTRTSMYDRIIKAWPSARRSPRPRR